MIAPMSATAALRDEHLLILEALDVLEAAAGGVGDDGGKAGPWRALLDWLYDFADARHHAKEEHWLFPALEIAGVPHPGGPLSVMLEEHEQGRALVRALRVAAPAQRGGLAHDYACLLRAHIAKENEILFELADALLEPGAVETLVRAYAEADAAQGAALTPEAAAATLHRLAGVLAPGAGTSSARAGT